MDKGPGPSRPRPRDQPASQANSDECLQLLKIIRKRCPGLITPAPLQAGAVAPEVTVPAGATQELFATAALNVAGLLDASGQPTGRAVLWADNDRELLVVVAAVRVRLASGVVAVTVPVRCEETGPVDVHVSFAVGDRGRPTGLLAACEERPRGPRLIVDLWGDSLVAFAWHLVLQVAAHVAFAAGTDMDGTGLVPAALAAGADGLAVLPQARHTFDRTTRP
jgi:hypothetical protein